MFFALFGAMVVGFSFHAAIRIDQPETRHSGSPAVSSDIHRPRTSYVGVSPAASNDGLPSLEARRLAAHLRLVYLNTLPALLRADLSEDEKQATARILTWTKLTIMEPLWDNDWGNKERFRDWAEGDMTEPVPPGLENAAAFFTADQNNQNTGGTGRKAKWDGSLLWRWHSCAPCLHRLMLPPNGSRCIARIS